MSPPDPPAERAAPRRAVELRWRGGSPPIGSKTFVMGIINVTDNSSYVPGFLGDPEGAVAQGLRFVAEGADILDVGGESARSDVPAVPPQEEIERVAPVIERLAREVEAAISVDTYKPEVAEAAIAAGATVINDIGGLKLGLGTAEVAARRGAALVVNYTYERPRVHPSPPPEREDLLSEHLAFLRERIGMAEGVGVPSEAIIVDPGIGFGKSYDEDMEVLRRLDAFRVLGRPILVGVSRKEFLGAALRLPPEDLLEATAAAVALAVARGADIVRVHDVKEMARAARAADAIVRGRLGDYAATPDTWPGPAH
jgi:dihydropteroate synthase